MTTPITASPIRLNIDQAEIFAQKTALIIKIKEFMLERKMTDKQCAELLVLNEREFRQIITGDYTNLPLAYLKTLHRRIQGEA